MTGSRTESGTPVIFASSIEMPVTPPSMKPLDSRKPFSPIPADMTPTAISAALSDSWTSRLRATVLGRHPSYVLTLRNVASVFSSFSTTAYEMVDSANRWRARQ